MRTKKALITHLFYIITFSTTVASIFLNSTNKKISLDEIKKNHATLLAANAKEAPIVARYFLKKFTGKKVQKTATIDVLRDLAGEEIAMLCASFIENAEGDILKTSTAKTVIGELLLYVPQKTLAGVPSEYLHIAAKQCFENIFRLIEKNDPLAGERLNSALNNKLLLNALSPQEKSDTVQQAKKNIKIYYKNREEAHTQEKKDLLNKSQLIDNKIDVIKAKKEKKEALARLKKSDPKDHLSIFQSLNFSLKTDNEIIFSCAHGFLREPTDTEKIPQEGILLSSVIRHQLAGSEKNHRRTKELLSRLEPIERDRLLDYTPDKEQKDILSKHLVASNSLPPLDEAPKENVKNIPSQQRHKDAIAALSSAAIFYAFLNWTEWSDIKNYHVFIPLIAGLSINRLCTNLTENGKLLIASAPLAGFSARHINQMYQKRSIRGYFRPKISTPQHWSRTALGAIGVISGFFTGIMDLTYQKIVNSFMDLCAGHIAKQPQKNLEPNSQSASPTKNVFAITCYLARTITPILDPLTTGSIAVAESTGKLVRLTNQKITHAWKTLTGQDRKNMVK